MKPKRVLVACEYSGIVRDAFLREGHDAISCDLLPTESPGPHVQGDVRPMLKEPWDLVVAHPPCSYLSNYNTSFKKWEQIDDFWERMEQAAKFFNLCRSANSPRVAIENPVPMPQARELIGSPDDYVEPYMFGHPYRKKTGLWLRALPPLMRGCRIVDPKSWVRDHPSKKILKTILHRPKTKGEIDKDSKASARFWPGIAEAMAKQWGTLP